MNILVPGGTGQVGRELKRYGEQAGHKITALGSAELDITDFEAVHAAVKTLTPSMVINAAAFTAVDKAEQDAGRAFAVNRDGAGHLARVCAEQNIPLLHISTDYVFDGRKTDPYREDDPVSPLGVYGESKWAGEQLIRERCDRHLIVRVSWVFGEYGNNFVRTIVRLAKERDELSVVADQRGCPTHAGAIARTLLSLAARPLFSDSSVYGTYHYCGSPVTTWHGFAEAVVAEARHLIPLRVRRVAPITTADYPTPATRPANSALDCRRLQAVFDIKPSDWRCGLMEVLARWLRPA